MSTVDTLKKMIAEVKLHNRPTEQLLQFYIQKRLDRSVKNYYDELLSSCNRLSQFNELSVAKKIIKD